MLSFITLCHIGNEPAPATAAANPTEAPEEPGDTDEPAPESASGLPLCDEKTTLTMLLGWSASDSGGLVDDLTEIKGVQVA